MSDKPSDRASPEATVPPIAPASRVGRLWRYQAERFPLAQHGALTIVFAAATASYAAALDAAAPSVLAIALGGLLALLQFLLLRIADEHKDFATDLAHRPYRPVPRGLVSLKELRAIGAIAGLAMALVIVAIAAPRLAIVLGALWVYFGLMWSEFFAHDWLTRRPALYLASHMLILPLIAWLVAGVQVAMHDGDVLSLPLRAPGFFFCVLFLGVVLELGRKIRARPDEERGVETYSALWGARAALTAWLSAAAIASAIAVLALAPVQGSLIVGGVPAAAGALVTALAALRFDAAKAGAGKDIERASSLLALLLLAALGVAPQIGAS